MGYFIWYEPGGYDTRPELVGWHMHLDEAQRMLREHIKSSKDDVSGDRFELDVSKKRIYWTRVYPDGQTREYGWFFIASARAGTLPRGIACSVDSEIVPPAASTVSGKY